MSWRVEPCTTCLAAPGDPCRNGQGDTTHPHRGRGRPPLEERVRVLEEQVRSLQMAAPRGIPETTSAKKDAT